MNDNTIIYLALGLFAGWQLGGLFVALVRFELNDIADYSKIKKKEKTKKLHMKLEQIILSSDKNTASKQQEVFYSCVSMLNSAGITVTYKEPISSL